VIAPSSAADSNSLSRRISFFTLRGCYLADVARSDAPLMSLEEYLLFKSFFAQLIADRSREQANAAVSERLLGHRQK